MFALLTGDSPNLALGVLILYAIVQFLEHNVLTPNITGGYVNLNPLVTIISIIIAGMVWGIIGMFIVIPFMATVKIVMEYFEPTQPYAFLMGIKEPNYDKIKWKRIRGLFIRKKKN
jgi:predicted PurR-regulated permease PerM